MARSWRRVFPHRNASCHRHDSHARCLPKARTRIFTDTAATASASWRISEQTLFSPRAWGGKMRHRRKKQKRTQAVRIIRRAVCADWRTMDVDRDAPALQAARHYDTRPRGARARTKTNGTRPQHDRKRAAKSFSLTTLIDKARNQKVMADSVLDKARLCSCSYSKAYLFQPVWKKRQVRASSKRGAMFGRCMR